jgi:hypothetical protein
MKTILYAFVAAVSFLSCSSSDETPIIPIQNPTPVEAMYFPPLTGNIWETKTTTALNWNSGAVQPLLDYLELKHTKSFMILVNGRIVFENYFNGHTATSPWYGTAPERHLLRR